MSLPDHHGWTHRPKALGGVDPIEIPAALPVSALGTSGLTSYTLDGNDIIGNTLLWQTPGGPYSPQGGDPSDYDNIMIAEDGFYRASFYVYWSSDFGGGSLPYIEPGCVVDGSQDSLVAFESLPFFGPVWDNTQSWIGGEQLDSAEMDHHSVYAEVTFNLSFSVAGISTFGVSNVLRSSFSGSKDVGGKLCVTRLGDYLEEVV